MPRLTRRTVTLAAVGAAVLAGAGAAVAGTGVLSGSSERQAFLDDAAKRLGVSSQQLENALKAAAEDRIDAAVAAGTITKEQGDTLKKASESGAAAPGHGIGFRGLFGFGAGHVEPLLADPLGAAATYLGLTTDELRTKLQSGKSLAQIAKDEGKSVAGLEQAMVASAKTKLDQAVSDGKITSAQRDQILSRLQQSIDDLVNRTFPKLSGGTTHRRYLPGSGFVWPGFHAFQHGNLLPLAPQEPGFRTIGRFS